MPAGRLQRPSTILGIESSCDDTAAAVVREGRLASSVISSQHVHAQFGGVVPELASRAHEKLIVPIVRRALVEAGIEQHDLTGIAATYGPGLAGSLLVGLSFGKAFAFGLGLPLIGVNHLEGHVYSIFLGEDRPEFPFVCLVVSGGHTQIVLVDDHFVHRTLGSTRDDAAGEAFDKVAKLFGLDYPGGPAIDQLAREGDPGFHDFPRSRPGGLDFSFSGLKTSVLYYLNAFSEDEREDLLANHLPDLCASFQQAVVDVLIDSLDRAVTWTNVRHIAIVGGVSANSALRRDAHALARRRQLSLHIPDPIHCVDNGAMIAMTGFYKLNAGITSPFTLTVQPSLGL